MPRDKGSPKTGPEKKKRVYVIGVIVLANGTFHERDKTFSCRH